MAKQQAGAMVVVLQELEDAEGEAAYFTCASGQLLWGQVHTVIRGFASAEVDTERGPDRESSDDEAASSFRYRVVARKGKWKVEAVFLDGPEGEPWHVGFVCHHVDADGVAVVRAAAEAGLGGNGKVADLEIVFVDRYEWSGSCSPGCEVIVQAVEGKVVDPEKEFEDERYYRSLVTGRYMLLDALGFPNLVQALKDGERIERRNYVMRDGKDSTTTIRDPKASRQENDATNCGSFGTHLVVDGSEYDMGWMAFWNGELVGFVYDGAYSALEGDNLRIGKNSVTRQ